MTSSHSNPSPLPPPSPNRLDIKQFFFILTSDTSAMHLNDQLHRIASTKQWLQQNAHLISSFHCSQSQSLMVRSNVYMQTASKACTARGQTYLNRDINEVIRQLVFYINEVIRQLVFCTCSHTKTYQDILHIFGCPRTLSVTGSPTLLEGEKH